LTLAVDIKELCNSVAELVSLFIASKFRFMLCTCARCVCVCLSQVLTTDLEFVRHIENEGLAGRSCTGIAVSNNGLVVVNWRTKTVTELSTVHGDTLFKFSHNAFQVKRPKLYI
jgi:hypothetical protein